MDYFTIAIVSAWILGVFYPVLGFMVVIGFSISRPVIDTRIYRFITWLFAAVFFGLGLHFLHLGYFGAVHGILPSQENLAAALANVVQVACLPPMLILVVYLRFKGGPTE